MSPNRLPGGTDIRFLIMLNATIKRLQWAAAYAGWLTRFLRLKFGMNSLRDIEILSIEFSSLCNLRCRYCFLEQGDRAKFLDVAIYEKLIKEVAEDPRYAIKTIEWPISGEFFVYKKWREVVDVTQRYMEKHPGFRPHVILNENFMLFDPDKVDYILGSGVVKQIICSFDGVDAESFERMRPPAKFDRCLKHFRYLVERNRELGYPVHLQINNGRDAECAGKKFSAEMEEILRAGDTVTQWRPEQWNESFNTPEAEFHPARGFCTFVFNNVTLLSSGFVSKCCMDLKGATAFADLSTRSLADIWSGAERRGFLERMFRNRRRDIPGCNTCSITSTNNDNRQTNVFRVMQRALKTLKSGREYFLRPLRE